MPYQSFAETDNNVTTSAETKKKAMEYIKNHQLKQQKKEAYDKKLKDAFYKALWKSKHGNKSVAVQKKRRPSDEQAKQIEQQKQEMRAAQEAHRHKAA